MREHLYKAKRVDWKELPKEEWWVEGNLLISNEDYYIIPDFGVSCVEKLNNYVCDKLITLHAYEVDPETVCEYTGLTDQNGRKIFERGILSFSAYGKNYKGDVRFIKGNFTIWCGKCAPFLDDALEKHYATVIGNIFDNPELLRGAGENEI